MYDAIYRPYDLKPIFLCLVQQVQPKSRGVVLLKSTDIRDPPLIDPNYLSDPRDLDDLVAGSKILYSFPFTNWLDFCLNLIYFNILTKKMEKPS